MRKLKIIKKTVSTDVKDVYDIEVDTDHHYLLENGVISHNSGPVYASSIVLAMRKLKLKEDEEGNKISDVVGIRAQCKVMKTRYNKPFETVEVKIPYDRGMDPYSGLFDLFVQKKILVKEGNKWCYTRIDGSQIKQFEKAWNRNDDGCLDIVMDEFHSRFTEKQIASDSFEDQEPVV